MLVNPRHTLDRTALTVTSTYEKYFALFLSVSLTIYGNSSFRKGFGTRLREICGRLSASFARWRIMMVHRRMIETFSFSAFSAFCESVCRLKTVEIQLDVEFSTSADSLTRRIWLWLAFPECHCRLVTKRTTIVGRLQTFNVDVVRYFQVHAS